MHPGGHLHSVHFTAFCSLRILIFEIQISIKGPVLNNYPPNDKKFDSVWKELNEAHSLGIKIVLMIGGSGSAYADLFSNFDIQN